MSIVCGLQCYSNAFNLCNIVVACSRSVSCAKTLIARPRSQRRPQVCSICTSNEPIKTCIEDTRTKSTCQAKTNQTDIFTTRGVSTEPKKSVSLKKECTLLSRHGPAQLSLADSEYNETFEDVNNQHHFECSLSETSTYNHVIGKMMFISGTVIFMMCSLIPAHPDPNVIHNFPISCTKLSFRS